MMRLLKKLFKNHMYTGIILVFSFLLINNPSVFGQENPDGPINWEKVNPSNGIEIAPNLYADITEISNHNWKEYLQYNKDVYGKNSSEYLDMLPDTTVWLRQTMIPHLYQTYFRNAFYDDFPVVGISKKQAMAYCEWRTNRVAEMYLIEQGWMAPNPGTTPENKFTIERYRAKEYHTVIEWNDMPFPIFRLPTNDEWELLAGGEMDYELGIDSTLEENIICQREQKSLFCTLEYVSSTQNESTYETHEGIVSERLITTAPCTSFATNVQGMYHTIGNVSEMISEDNLSKGGSWKDQISNLDIKKTIEYEGPNCWTGFRCVSSWEN